MFWSLSLEEGKAAGKPWQIKPLSRDENLGFFLFLKAGKWYVSELLIVIVHASAHKRRILR